MYFFSKSISNSAQYVTPDSKIYCEKVPKSPSFALLYKCYCSPSKPEHLHHHVFIAFSSKFIAFLACDSCNWDIYSCHFSIVMGVSCSFTTLPNTFKPWQSNPPQFLTTHKCHPIVASSLLLVWYFDDLKTKMFYLAHLHVFCLNTLELHLHLCSSLSQIKEEGHVWQERLPPQSSPSPRWMGVFTKSENVA
jgi:hypothetical protein